MKKKISMFFLPIFCFILLIGCSEKLSGEKTTVEGQEITYQFQLPAKWEKVDSFQEKFNKKAVFGAEDTRSNSSMFIMIYLKSTVDLKDFPSKTRLELQKRYGYKELDGVYMKEYEINKHKAIKYTLNTTFQEKDVWAHFYYLETEHGFVELIFYSANDGDYKERSIIIDESVETLVEVKSKGSNDSTNSTELEKSNGDTVEVKNANLTFTIDGVMTLLEDEKSKKLVLHYQLTNLGNDNVIPKEIQSYIIAEQKGIKLTPEKIADGNQDLDLRELALASDRTVTKGETMEGIWVYSLQDTSDVVLTFNQDQFKDEKPQTIYLPK
ncbi:hypothetical protein BCR24_07505 [Enterococcus ureilyticus]|uniref:DUF5067 domain-containing protein n=1 Tax=Enterococcus ureilyticus TaxID=1131292 RepID=A0A1E5H8S1_9ENTE|nr:DUF5067 domain-containing protein [Enterococcus ureilyticus]MBM7687468.1 hypothetical protein [Enterococcus ureilyticus]OEG21304.1 hypothetical protein BCR24_07505 [Enterococcus ureilyticus]